MLSHLLSLPGFCAQWYNIYHYCLLHVYIFNQVDKLMSNKGHQEEGRTQMLVVCNIHFTFITTTDLLQLSDEKLTAALSSVSLQ